eukprot:TRINITY_DN12679_c0_g3_i1.p1 TRINITY_DN12679_c0_g3~~TRINITY_DN12679_c0_g3_i1.p1  ORF type:complete len:506 (+),score=73.61 TRINITY_DN12679_c0_g3_i1:69-1520(+)
MCIRDRNRVTKDLSLVDNDFPGILGQTLVVVIGGLTEVGVSIYGATYYITPIIIIALVSAHYINRYYMKTYTEIVRLESITKSPILCLFSESLNGVTTIRAFGKENEFMQHQLNLLNENIKNQITQSGLSRWFSLRLNIISLVCLIIPTIGVCLIWKERLSPGFSGLLLAYCFDLDSRLINLLSNLNNFASRLVSFERCLAFTTIKSERDYHTKQPPPGFDPARWPTMGNVAFDRYSVRYRENLPLVLKNVSLSIRCGEKIGVVGRTGAGKSSMILALLRLLEADSGRILIDGVNIAEIGLHDLRKNITIIPQDTYLFNGTLRVNIDPLSAFTDQEIWRALEKVKLKETFEQKGGLECMVSESGDSLSVGEKQLLSIARGILKRSNLILMDEATSSIDIVTERLIQQTIKKEFGDKTVITIAHRLNTIIMSDRILMLGLGEVKEFDRPDVLLRDHNSLFFKFWEEANKQSLEQFQRCYPLIQI